VKKFEIYEIINGTLSDEEIEAEEVARANEFIKECKERFVESIQRKRSKSCYRRTNGKGHYISSIEIFDKSGDKYMVAVCRFCGKFPAEYMAERSGYWVSTFLHEEGFESKGYSYKEEEKSNV
jgi:hypothetical protein